MSAVRCRRAKMVFACSDHRSRLAQGRCQRVAGAGATVGTEEAHQICRVARRQRQRAATERRARVGWRSEWQRVVKGWLATEGKARFARTGLRERCKVGRGWRIAAGGSRSCRRGSAQHSKTHNNQTGEGGANESRTAAIDDVELLAGRGWLWIGSRGRCSEEAFGIERRRGATPENVAILSWMATPAASLAAGQCSRVALHPPFRHLSDRCDGALKLLTCPPPVPLNSRPWVPGCLAVGSLLGMLARDALRSPVYHLGVAVCLRLRPHAHRTSLACLAMAPASCLHHPGPARPPERCCTSSTWLRCPTSSARCASRPA